MCKIVKRGHFPSDEKEFTGKHVDKLYKAGQDLYYLLNQGYNIKGASVFVGNHYLLSERQRLALSRAISSEKNIKIRKEKEVKDNLKNSIVNIDGFNTIITLEVALSNSLLIKCMDGTIRDLAGLRGTYRIIDKTELSIMKIGETLEKHKIKKANFYLDAPVSNSGNLKKKIEELLKNFDFEVEVMNINNVDSTLETLDNVISSDAIILDKCKSWININREILDKKIENNLCVDFNL
ncbi:MAG: DUF434 domain-containing protein [Terrisporobacter othiniensis]|uniref:DUF434 domain-containing protein n=1 Tax=Terrisporobacter petrolearius TaxID=1460447 RepID=UPI0022E3AEEA|nr:DUF434 domain-containing protein [Terrisporobacter petrolearius]MDU4861112.1 DUF434 domain-containing protein [Terrisporobacter othiniensis]MDU6994746.1 DUF434 domain-containing protein [Terrisporobacter othiniensis]